MKWSEDGWLRPYDDNVLAKLEVPEPNLPKVELATPSNADDFVGEKLNNYYYTPRIMPDTFASVTERHGYVRIRGCESQASLNVNFCKNVNYILVQLIYIFVQTA